MSLQSFHTYDFDNDPDYQEGVASILSQIPGQLPEEDRKAMLLDAKCFYFSRKHNLNPPITSAAYTSYLTSNNSTTTTESSLSPSAIPLTTTPPTASALPPSLPPSIPATTDEEEKERKSQETSPSTSSSLPPPPSTTTTSAPSQPQPTYPPTFNELIDLITSNKPIPGIEEIPDTVIADKSLAAFSGTGGAPLDDQEAGSTSSAPRERRKPWEKEEVNKTEAETGTALVGDPQGEGVRDKPNLGGTEPVGGESSQVQT